MRVFFVILALFGAIAAQVSPVRAQGVVRAVAYLPLPGGISVEVRTFDDSDNNMELKRELEKALRARGIGTADDAPYILNFEVKNRIGSLTTAGNRHVLSLESRGGRGGGEDAKARVNVYDSYNGGLLNKGVGDSRVSNRTVYRLDVDIEDRSSGKRLWDGWAEAELVGGDGHELTLGMVPAVVARIGETVKRAAFKP